MRNHQCFGKRTLDQSYPEWNKVTCVCAHVYLQKCSAMELLVAVLTIVLFLALHLSRVRAQMLSQVVLATEHASTHLQANACKLLRCITRYLCECTPSIKTDITASCMLLAQACYLVTWHGCEGRGLPSHPVWITWRSRWYLRLNCFLQRVHEYGFNPATIRDSSDVWWLTATKERRPLELMLTCVCVHVASQGALVRTTSLTFWARVRVTFQVDDAAVSLQTWLQFEVLCTIHAFKVTSLQTKDILSK